MAALCVSCMGKLCCNYIDYAYNYDRGSACSNFITVQLWFFSFPYLLFCEISKIPSSGNSLMNSNEFHVGSSLFSDVCKHRILAQISLVSLSRGLWGHLKLWIQYVQYYFLIVGVPFSWYAFLPLLININKSFCVSRFELNSKMCITNL